MNINQIIDPISNVYDKLWRRKYYKIYLYQYTKNKKRVELQSQYPLTDEQKKQIDDYYMAYYGSKIPYECHQNFAVHTGVFRYDYFPDFLYVPYFEHFINYQKGYAKVLEDKSVFPFFASKAGVKMPITMVYNTFGVFRDGDYNCLSKKNVKELLNNAGRVFVKPTIESGSAKGIFTANFKDGVDQKSGKTIDEIFDSKRKNYAVQEFVKCCQELANLYNGCVNTFRIMTYRWKDGFYVMPGVLRIGSGGGEVDNAHAGGMFVAIDEDGVLKGKAMTEFMNVYEKHPDSGILFEGYRISEYPKVVEAALKLHTMIPEIGCVAWDFTIDDTNSPLLIEANILNSGFWIIQCAHPCAPFGERQPEVLQWIKLMKSVPVSEREKYSFGHGL